MEAMEVVVEEVVYEPAAEVPEYDHDHGDGEGEGEGDPETYGEAFAGFTGGLEDHFTELMKQTNKAPQDAWEHWQGAPAHILRMHSFEPTTLTKNRPRPHIDSQHSHTP